MVEHNQPLTPYALIVKCHDFRDEIGRVNKFVRDRYVIQYLGSPFMITSELAYLSFAA